MRMDDYIPIDKCQTCGAKVWSPTSWVGRGKNGAYNPTPRVPTCQCYKRPKTEYKKGGVIKEGV